MLPTRNKKVNTLVATSTLCECTLTAVWQAVITQKWWIGTKSFALQHSPRPTSCCVFLQCNEHWVVLNTRGRWPVTALYVRGQGWLAINFKIKRNVDTAREALTMKQWGAIFFQGLQIANKAVQIEKRKMPWAVWFYCRERKERCVWS